MPISETAQRNLDRYDNATRKAVLELYGSVNNTLKELIIDDSVQLQKATNMLMSEYNAALESQDFVANFKKGTITTISKSTYVNSVVDMGIEQYTIELGNTALFNDGVTMSKRIRKNSALIVRDQKRILRKSLKEGRAVADIARKLNGFTEDLPKFIKELSDAKIAGAKLPKSAIRKAEKQIAKIKTKGLKSGYNQIINALGTGKNIDRAVSNAMVKRTRYYANRVAKNETVQALSDIKNERALQNVDTHFVRNIHTSTADAICLAHSDLGWVPVENAEIAIFHVGCNCSPAYKRSLAKPKAWSDKKYTTKLQSNFNKRNREQQAKGKPKDYSTIGTPTNLRDNTFLDKLGRGN
jgi:hypothetical protein